MEWLFERIIELAAWVALILGVIFLCEAIYLLALWVRSLSSEPAPDLIVQSGQSAAKFVASAVALGVLASIDRYVFDQPEPPSHR